MIESILGLNIKLDSAKLGPYKGLISVRLEYYADAFCGFDRHFFVFLFFTFCNCI